jgi:hypothetical protein
MWRVTNGTFPTAYQDRAAITFLRAGTPGRFMRQKGFEIIPEQNGHTLLISNSSAVTPLPQYWITEMSDCDLLRPNVPYRIVCDSF